MDAYYETDLNENGIMCLNVTERSADGLEQVIPVCLLLLTITYSASTRF